MKGKGVVVVNADQSVTVVDASGTEWTTCGGWDQVVVEDGTVTLIDVVSPHPFSAMAEMEGRRR